MNAAEIRDLISGRKNLSSPAESRAVQPSRTIALRTLRNARARAAILVDALRKASPNYLSMSHLWRDRRIK